MHISLNVSTSLLLQSVLLERCCLESPFALSTTNCEYLGNEQQGQCDSDGHVGVCEREQ